MLDALYEIAEQAARAAGAEARRWFDGEANPRDKGFRQLVTEGDIAAQRAAMAVIRARFPDHAILAEEEGADTVDERRLPGGVTWLIDPVDGTANFARHLPFFNVSLAAAIDGQPAVGVVFDPLRENLFAAVRGRGARLDGRPLQIGKRAQLGDALVGFDSPPEPEIRQRQWAVMSQIAARCRTVRGLGSAALGMAYVAAGWLDAYLHLGLHPWDAAAGALLVEEAGGVVRQPDGKAWRLGQPSVLMCNPGLLDALVEAIQSTPEW
jgi:myo-inositol-1(or 4)-monophosphatase